MTPRPTPPSSPAGADWLLVLIAPNVSERMGGEAIKALQIFQTLRALHPRTVQITHGRNRAELTRLGLADLHYVDDDALQRSLWRSRIGRPALDAVFMHRAVRLAEHLAATLDPRGPLPALIHATEPNSPVSPRSTSRRHPTVFGPVNGNIYYPPLFRAGESRSDRLRRWGHMPMQCLNRLRPGGMRAGALLLVAGGRRTHDSLRMAACDPARMRDTVDCGLPEALFEHPRITHHGPGLRFVHFGRLVYYKGTQLAIEALARTRAAIELDILGDGPERAACEARVQALGLQQRVRFLPWCAREALPQTLRAYRGMVLPSFGDSNGIVVQEVMALGLPPVCLDWGGPSQLIEAGRDGELVPVGDSREAVLDGLAAALDRLAGDPAHAEALSVRARQKAQGWLWPAVARDWLQHYPAPR